MTVSKKTFNNDEVALLIRLSKSQYYANLTSRLTTFFDNILTVTQLNLQPLWQQRVWALRQMATQPKIENYIVLLSSLNNERTASSGIWEKFRQWQRLTSRLKNKAIIEVQASDELSEISSKISNSLLGGAGKTYWLQPSIKSKTAKKGPEYVAQVVLSIELLESDPPYRVLFTNSLKKQQRAPSKKSAKQRAMKAIAQLIESSNGQALFNKDGPKSIKEYL